MREQTIIVTDPVCGTQIEIEKAAGQADHGGWAYFFCSQQCCRLFMKTPEHYVGREQRPSLTPAAETESENHE